MQTSPNTSEPDITKLFDKYLRGISSQNYFTEKGYLREELLVAQADLVAQKFSKAGVTMGQLRKFFMMARSLERMTDQQDFEAVIPAIASFQPLAAYVVGRPQMGNKLIPLRQFIDANVPIAKRDKKHFVEGFLPHFESIVAYFTFYNNQTRSGGGDGRRPFHHNKGKQNWKR